LGILLNKKKFVISLCGIPIINILNSIMIVVTLCGKSIIVSRFLLNSLEQTARIVTMLKWHLVATEYLRAVHPKSFLKIVFTVSILRFFENNDR
jgi:hypothetical protein